MALSDVLSDLRKDKHLGQKDLATYLNISVSTISNYETGTHEPDFETLCKLADLFDVSADYLLGRTMIPYDLKKLSKPLRNGISLNQIIQSIVSLDNKNLDSMIDYLDLLYYRSRMVAERNEYDANLKSRHSRTGIKDNSMLN